MSFINNFIYLLMLSNYIVYVRSYEYLKFFNNEDDIVEIVDEKLIETINSRFERAVGNDTGITYDASGSGSTTDGSTSKKT